MKIDFKNEFDKKFIEILPAITCSYYGGFTLYFGWLYWCLIIEF